MDRRKLILVVVCAMLAVVASVVILRLLGFSGPAGAIGGGVAGGVAGALGSSFAISKRSAHSSDA